MSSDSQPLITSRHSVSALADGSQGAVCLLTWHPGQKYVAFCLFQLLDRLDEIGYSTWYTVGVQTSVSLSPCPRMPGAVNLHTVISVGRTSNLACDLSSDIPGKSLATCKPSCKPSKKLRGPVRYSLLPDPCHNGWLVRKFYLIDDSTPCSLTVRALTRDTATFDFEVRASTTSSTQPGCAGGQGTDFCPTSGWAAQIGFYDRRLHASLQQTFRAIPAAPLWPGTIFDFDI